LLGSVIANRLVSHDGTVGPRRGAFLAGIKGHMGLSRPVLQTGT
jgi:hypothetical protein